VEPGVDPPVFSVLSETPEMGEPRPLGLFENKSLEDLGIVNMISTLSSSSLATVGFLPFEGELVGVLMVRFGLRERTGEDGSEVSGEATETLWLADCASVAARRIAGVI